MQEQLLNKPDTPETKDEQAAQVAQDIQDVQDARAALLSFDRIVQETAFKLEANGVAFNAEMVKDVLQDAGIDEVLRQATPEPKGHLLIRRVHLIGDKRRTESTATERFEYKRDVGSGLHAWVGQNGSGKSSILNCVIWALTGADSGVARRIRSWLTDIGVWFSIGGADYTSRVTRTGESITGGVYNGFKTFDQVDLGDAEAVFKFKTRDEMRDALDVFFMQQLGITSLRWTAHGSEKDDPDLHAHSTTWRTYAHAIQIEDDSYDDLIIDPQKGYGRQDRKILEMMLGVDHARVVSEIQVQADFAREAYGRARSRVGNKQADISTQIGSLEQELADVEQALHFVHDEKTPAQEDTAVNDKRERRSALLAAQNKLTSEIATLNAQPDELERAVLELEREKVAITEQSEVEYLINSLAVVRCPHCESAVDNEDRLVRERHDHTCHVCNQPIQRTRAKGDLKAILKERDDEISALRGTLKRIKTEIAEREAQLLPLREEATKLGRELETSVTQAREGFTVSYTNLLLRKGQIEGHVTQLRRSQQEVESERVEVETAARWHTILQTAAEIADESVYSMYQNAFGELCTLAAELARKFGVPDLERVLIDEKRYVKVQQGGLLVSHHELARSERVKFKVAFHIALMLIQVRSGLGKHPRFLIIDTPGTAEVDAPDLIAMTRDLARLNAEYGESIQIFLATAREETLEHLPTALVERPQANGTFF